MRFFILLYFALPLETSDTEFKKSCFRKAFQRMAHLSPHYVDDLLLSLVFLSYFPKRDDCFQHKEAF